MEYKTAQQIIDEHRASLSQELEDRIIEMWSEPDTNVADLALRKCRCGREIDGFYDYADHLIEEINKEAAKIAEKLRA